MHQASAHSIVLFPPATLSPQNNSNRYGGKLLRDFNQAFILNSNTISIRFSPYNHSDTETCYRFAHL